MSPQYASLGELAKGGHITSALRTVYGWCAKESPYSISIWWVSSIDALKKVHTQSIYGGSVRLMR